MNIKRYKCYVSCVAYTFPQVLIFKRPSSEYSPSGSFCRPILCTTYVKDDRGVSGVSGVGVSRVSGLAPPVIVVNTLDGVGEGVVVSVVIVGVFNVGEGVVVSVVGVGEGDVGITSVIASDVWRSGVVIDVIQDSMVGNVWRAFDLSTELVSSSVGGLVVEVDLVVLHLSTAFVDELSREDGVVFLGNGVF